ncbi:carbamoyltransferase [Fictibacillus solisalsi]|uniref:Carbamoyltransferase n=1 Tax=Fictibacillus solisalsi TaxID=459525 RepID=A0A1H0BTI5_9BACL|nr:carbamoyltransferase C-terminal domain-containing protein [Fictibacillus solisalsi]SDN48897.1 carbamoyltransferase [Fictibacillus solisalsi]
MKILGLGGSGHNFSACIVEDGRLVYAIEEERLNRVKYALFPPDASKVKLARNYAAKYCLKQAGYTMSDIDYVATNDIIDPRYISKYQYKLQTYNHHLTHASSVFFTSPFTEAAIMVIDGSGSEIGNTQYETISFFYAEGNKLNKFFIHKGNKSKENVYEFLPNNSLGGFYRAVTEAIGFHFLEDGKTMGLSSYGSDRYIDDFHRFYTYSPHHGFLQSDQDIQDLKMFILDELSLSKNSFKTKADFARAVQYHIEELLIQLAFSIYEKTKSKHLCISGGVALNSVANSRILKETPFEKVYIFPASADSGCAIGSALYLYYVQLQNPWSPKEEPFSPYLGAEYDAEVMEKTLEEYKEHLCYRISKNIFEDTAAFLNEGKIIGWYQGRSEIGPRALGNRSVIADPRKIETRQRINQSIKRREFFRPLAPAIMEEYLQDYFVDAVSSYHMLYVNEIQPSKAHEIEAVSHIDGTARVQTVTRKSNPIFYALLEHYKNLTGIPLLLNTSFNGSGEPIVESPKDAINSYIHLGLDVLIMDEFIIERRNGFND